MENIRLWKWVPVVSVSQPPWSSLIHGYRLCNRKNGAHSEVFNFTTANRGEGVKFLFVGDSSDRLESVQQDGEAWKRTLEVGKHILPNAEFLISAGDQSDSSKTDIAIEEYYEFRSPDELKNIPVAVNKGNHEHRKGDLWRAVYASRCMGWCELLFCPWRSSVFRIEFKQRQLRSRSCSTSLSCSSLIRFLFVAAT